jgi:hypothetical protein
MSSFAVEVTEDPTDDEGQHYGRIRINGHVERFPMDVGFWSPDDYRRSWWESCARLDAAPGDIASCLVASTGDPAKASFIWTWPLHRIGNTVFVQNNLVFLDELETPLDLTRPWLATGPRQTHTEDGQPISEWSVPLSAVRKFLKTQPAGGVKVG